MRHLLPLLLVLCACKGKDGVPNRLMDTGWFTETTTLPTQQCDGLFGGSEPSAGVQDWYWRDNPRFYVEQASAESYTFALRTADGVEVPSQPTWSEDGLWLTFELDEPLDPLTDYVMTVIDCEAVHLVEFRTSKHGQPLTIDPSDLEGLTFDMDMLGANWVAPAGAEALVALYFSSPALLGIRFTDGERIDWMGSQGDVDAFGKLFQAPGSTWDFPLGTLEGPYFEVDADLVRFEFDGVSIPIHGAHFEGTLAADGTSIGGARLSGLGDTSGLGEFIGAAFADDPEAVCNLAAGLGVSCETCPDGAGDYCLFMSAVDLEGALIPGLALVPSD